jgi:two-component sensor histidine kinase
MYEDHDERMWLGSYGDGLFVYPLKGSGTTDGHLDSIVGLPDKSVRSLSQDQQQRLWVGTRYGGIIVLDGPKRQTISTREGLLSDAVWCLLEDRRGTYWIGTELGLMSLKNLDTMRLQRHPELFGFPIISLGISRDEKIWATSPDEFIIYDYYRREVKPPPPPIAITRLEVNHRSVPIRNDMELTHHENDLLLEYVGTGFCRKGEMRYQYQLLPIEKEWQSASAQRSVHFSALEPGTYTFVVRALNGYEVSSTTPAVLVFTIASPYWATWWFQTLVVLCLVSIPTHILYLRLRRMKHLELIRSRIARDLHDDIGASLTHITLFSEVAHKEMKSLHSGAASHNSTEKISLLLQDISQHSRDLVDAMSDVVWSMNPSNDSFEDLTLRMKNYTNKLLSPQSIGYEFAVSPGNSVEDLPLEFKRNCYLIFKEVLNNILRHAKATHVALRLTTRDRMLIMTIQDNGTGFNPKRNGEGNGMHNMQQRAAAMRGNLEVRSLPDQGTSITLTVKLP